MKKLLSFLILSVTIALGATNVYADSTISVYVNGSKVSYDTNPIIKNGSTLVPLRQTFEALGSTVDWNSAAKTITANKNNTTIKLTIGQKTAYKDNSSLNIAVAPEIINGRTYVPLRFVAESLGAGVKYDANTKTVTIASEGITPSNVPSGYKLLNTSDWDVIVDGIISGKVIEVDGKYYATSDYINSFDIQLPEVEMVNRFENPGTPTWVGGLNFKKNMVDEKFLVGIDTSNLEVGIPGTYEIYCIADDSGFMSTKYEHFLPDMTDEFFNAENATGTFSGIRMKKENGQLLCSIEDVKAKGIKY